MADREYSPKPSNPFLRRRDWLLVGWAAAFAVAACGGSAEPAPYVPVPAPDCSPPVTPIVATATTPVGPVADPGCRQPIGTSALPAAQVQHLGTLGVNATAHFDVPEGTGSFTIVLQAVTASAGSVTFAGSAPLPNAPLPLKISDPAGAVFFDDTSAVPSDYTQLNAIYHGGRSGAGAFTVPNTSRTLSAWARGVPVGRWTFTVGDYAAECANVGAAGCSTGADLGGSYDTTVLLRPGPLASTGTLDVNFYLVTSRFQAATAPQDSGLARMVSTLAAIYARAGFCLGKVTFLDVPQWAREKFATGIDATRTGPCDNLSQLFTLSLPGSALQLFLVDDIRQGGVTGVRTLGIDGAIPGLSTVGGTALSGAVINVSDLGQGTCGASADYVHCGSDTVAAVAGHEAAHWLGLFHVTEKYGTVFDTVSDTPTCACAQCAPDLLRANCGTTGAQVTGADCNHGTCGGGDNLMFWLVGGDLLTAQQGQLMRANPLVR